VLRYHHYAYRTEQTYCNWILLYIKFHGSKIHPAQMGKTQIDAFLSHLATHDRVSAATQRQALNAIVFLYRHVLDHPIEDQLEPVKANNRFRPPVVMTQAEVQHVISHLEGIHLLMAKMLYGCGLRLMECDVFGFRILILTVIFSMCGPQKGAWKKTSPLSKAPLTAFRETPHRPYIRIKSRLAVES
jgi:integrase